MGCHRKKFSNRACRLAGASSAEPDVSPDLGEVEDQPFEGRAELIFRLSFGRKVRQLGRGVSAERRDRRAKFRVHAISLETMALTF
jgi:hypothetical protein